MNKPYYDRNTYSDMQILRLEINDIWKELEKLDESKEFIIDELIKKSNP